MRKNELPKEHLELLAEFRQQAYELLDRQGDVLFEITDAIIQTPLAGSYAELSLAPALSRGWGSMYKAVAKGKVDNEGLKRLCAQQLPSGNGRLHFALDVMAIRRMHSPTLKERVFCHGAKREVGGKGIIIGLPYSILAYVEEEGKSWAPSVDIRRLKPDQSAVDVAVEQSRWLARQLPQHSLAEIALDGGYGNLKFFCGMSGLKNTDQSASSISSISSAGSAGSVNGASQEACGCFATARMRNDRVLYQLPPAVPQGQKKPPGRSLKYGRVFRFSDKSTWSRPDEVLEFEDPKFGKVQLELWLALRLRVRDVMLDISVVRSQIHLEQAKPPPAHWYGVHNGTAHKTTLARVFECITHRWPIEPANRFHKDRLYADLPKLRSAQATDLWMTLLQIVEWELFLWRKAATDVHLPWQKPLSPDQLTPGRVIRSLAQHLPQLATPVKPLLPRGYSPGWPIGRKRTPPPTYRLLSKSPKKTKKTNHLTKIE